MVQRLTQLTESNIILATIRFGLGGLLLSTGLVKFVSWPYFPTILFQEYTMIPRSLTPPLLILEPLSLSHFWDYLAHPLAFIVPLIEIGIGLLLILGIKPKKMGMASMGLFLLFFSVLFIQHVFISPVEDCGCAPGFLDTAPVTMVFDLVFAFLSYLLILGQRHPLVLWSD